MTDHSEGAPALPWGLQPVDVITAAATGLLTLPDPARRTPLTRFALRTAAAAITGAGVWAGTGEHAETRHDLATRAGFTAGAVGLVYGAAELGEWLDRRLHRRLERMGVRRPRVAMAVVGVGLGLAFAVLDRRPEPGGFEEGDLDAPEGPAHDPLRDDVRELADAILAETEDYESLRLRAQLAAATEVRWGAEPDDVSVELSVPDDVPRVVPHDYTFPVSAHFTSARGVPCSVRLHVTGGRLSAVAADIRGEAWDLLTVDRDPEEDPFEDVRLPRLSEVTLVTETSSSP